MSSPVTLQPCNADNFIMEAAKTANEGAVVEIDAAATSAARFSSAIMFDFSASVPAGATITVATLSLYAFAVVAGRTITISRLLHTDWVENQMTWNIYKTGSNWNTAGALGSGTDFDPTDAATSASVLAGHWQTWDVKNQVQTALDSVSGVAHFLLADYGAAATSRTRYYSREYATTTLRPILYIEYTASAGVVVPNFFPFFWA